MSTYPEDEPAAPSNTSKPIHALPDGSESKAQGDPLSPKGKEQARLLGLLDTNQAKLARLFAGLPTFDTVLKRLLVDTLQTKIPSRKLRAARPEEIDPDFCYVGHFTVDSNGGRLLTTSESFTDVLWRCLQTDTPATYTGGGVGFFTRPGSVKEADSLFSGPLDAQDLRAMEAVLYLANPTTSERVKRQFRDDLAQFRSRQYREDTLELPTTTAAFAHWLSLRFLHLFNLYKVDRGPTTQLTPSERIQQKDEDRLLDIITTHPSKADRNRLLLTPIPHVYNVMLDMGTAAPQKWPGAMVIKFTDRLTLFLYSLEGGIQRFRSVQDLTSNVQPTYDGQERTILDISSELSGHVFEVAADDLLQLQRAALETVLNASGNEAVALNTFARRAESALGLPMLSLAGPLAVRQQTLVENNRPGFYKTATRSEQAQYRRLEGQVFKAVYALGGGVQTLLQFTRQQIRQYLEGTVYPGLEPDPDKTMVTLFQGKGARPSQVRTSSLTQLMLDNLRPHQYPNAMREVLTVYVVDQHGQRVRHPASGFLVTLRGSELARMAIRIDVGGRYETYLRTEMNKPHYKAAWQAAYLANLKFKGYEASLRGDEVFKSSLLDKAFTPPMARKRVACWLDAVLRSPTAAGRAWVDGRKVCVHGLVLGGSVGVGRQQDALSNAVSIDGVLIFSDQDGPDIQGTVGVYFPDSPGGDDFREFADLSDGIAGLLPKEEWQAYFRSRISTLDPAQIKRLLGQQGGRPLIRGVLFAGDFLESLHQAYVNFQSAYADHRSNSNRDISRQTAAKLAMMTVEIIFDLAGLFLVPGFQMLTRAIKTGLLVVRTGAVPMNLPTLAFVHKVANYAGKKGLAGGVTVPVRGQSSFLALTARQSPGETLAGLPLEAALYRRYAVTDTSLIRGVTPDRQGFYRPTITDNATGSVTRPVYVRQPDGTVFRVHDHTRLRATEANIVDPVTGLSIRSSGVSRSTVARMPDGEWRAVGHGWGGGKRSRETSPQPGPSNPKRPATSPRTAANLVRTSGEWDVEIMDLAPALITRLPNWPSNRSLLIIEQRPDRQDWSVRFTPGQVERAYPATNHPLRSDTDVVLTRIGENHYNLMLGEEVVEFDANGDCFFNATARGLNEGLASERFSMQGLRNDLANYIERHPEVTDYLVAQPSGIQQALSDNARTLAEIMGEPAVLDLTQVIYGGANSHRLFEPIRNYLNLYIRAMESRVLSQAYRADLPPEMLQYIGRLLSPRPPGRLALSSIPYYTQKSQSLQAFFEDVLLPPIDSREIAELLNNEYLMLSQDVVHIMLEYGVRARDLTDHHPRNKMAYVRFDKAVHGQLRDEQLEQQLNGALLVEDSDLQKTARRFERETGRVIDEDTELMDQFMYYDRVEDLTDLLTVSLGRYPVLLSRAQILLRSPVIASNLGGLFPVNVLAAWIRNPALSDARLQIIAAYAGSRYREVVRSGRIDIDWMRPFDDANLRYLVYHQKAFLSFWDFLQGARYLDQSNMSTATGLFRVAGQMASNRRIAVFFEVPNLWRSIQNMPGISPRSAWRIWEDLVGPQFSDENIRRTLLQRDALSSESAFTSALIDSLALDEAQAHRVILGAYGVTPRQVQDFLNNFDFPGTTADHSRLTLALYLSHSGTIPDWAWQYARPGVTPESLRSFLATRKTPIPE